MGKFVIVYGHMAFMALGLRPKVSRADAWSYVRVAIGNTEGGPLPTDLEVEKAVVAYCPVLGKWSSDCATSRVSSIHVAEPEVVDGGVTLRLPEAEGEDRGALILHAEGDARHLGVRFAPLLLAGDGWAQTFGCPTRWIDAPGGAPKDDHFYQLLDAADVLCRTDRPRGAARWPHLRVHGIG